MHIIQIHIPYMGPGRAGGGGRAGAHVRYNYVFVYVYAYVYVYALCTYLDKNIFQSQHPEEP